MHRMEIKQFYLRSFPSFSKVIENFPLRMYFSSFLFLLKRYLPILLYSVCIG